MAAKGFFDCFIPRFWLTAGDFFFDYSLDVDRVKSDRITGAIALLFYLR